MRMIKDYSDPSEALLSEDEEYTKKLRVLMKGIIQSRDRGKPAHRALHPRSIGFAHGRFEVLADLPAELAVGLFKEPATYEARLRFSNANAGFDPDHTKGIRGLAIKLIGTPGKKLIDHDESDPGFDFILNSHTIMPVAGVRGFFELNQAFMSGSIVSFMFKNPGTAWKLITSAASHASPLDARYWSMVPYRLGDRVVKYSLVPTSNHKSKMPGKRNGTHLEEAFANHLKSHEASFDFKLQFGVGERSMPIEDASVEWSEKKSPFVTVARITLPVQDTTSDALKEEGELMAFNPWHVTAEHEPLGGINRARKTIYQELSAFRLKKRNK